MKLILHDQLTALSLPASFEDDLPVFPTFTGGDKWHSICPILDLNIWEDGEETKAAIYLCHEGNTLTNVYIPLQVVDKRTRSEPKQ